MKYIFILIFLILFLSCATIKVPNENIVVFLEDGFITLEKGSLGEEYRKQIWMNKEKFMGILKDAMLDETI